MEFKTSSLSSSAIFIENIAKNRPGLRSGLCTRYDVAVVHKLPEGWCGQSARFFSSNRDRDRSHPISADFDSFGRVLGVVPAIIYYTIAFGYHLHRLRSRLDE